MVDNNYVEILAIKIFTNEINPKTGKPFILEDIKKEEYKQPVSERIKQLDEEKKQNDKEGDVIGN